MKQLKQDNNCIIFARYFISNADNMVEKILEEIIRFHSYSRYDLDENTLVKLEFELKQALKICNDAERLCSIIEMDKESIDIPFRFKNLVYEKIIHLNRNSRNLRNYAYHLLFSSEQTEYKDKAQIFLKEADFLDKNDLFS